MRFTAEQINMAFSNLLEAKSMAMVKLGAIDIARQLVSKYNLEKNKSLVLENNIVFVLIDLLDIRDFEAYLRKDVGLSIDEARQILIEIEEKIFKPVRDLTNYYLEEKEEDLIGEEKKISGVSSLRAIHGKDLNNRAAFGVESIFQSRVIDIGKKYKLSIDQLGALVSVTNLVISGEIYASQYRGRLKEKISIDDATFEKIVADVNEEVFKKIRQKIIGEGNNESFLNDKDIPIPPYASASTPLLNKFVLNENNNLEKKSDSFVLSPDIKTPTITNNLIPKPEEPVVNNNIIQQEEIIKNPETEGLKEKTENKITPPFIKPITNDPTPIYDTISSPDISQKNEGITVSEPEKITDNIKNETPNSNIPAPSVEIQNEIIPSPINQNTINDSLKNVDLDNKKQAVVTENNILVNSGIEIPIANQEMPDVEIIDEENNTSSTIQNTDISSVNIPISPNGQNPINNNVFSSSGIEIPIPNTNIPSVEPENKTPSVVEPSAKEDPIFSQNNSIYADSGVEIISDNKKSSTDDPYKEVI